MTKTTPGHGHIIKNPLDNCLKIKEGEKRLLSFSIILKLISQVPTTFYLLQPQVIAEYLRMLSA